MGRLIETICLFQISIAIVSVSSHQIFMRDPNRHYIVQPPDSDESSHFEHDPMFPHPHPHRNAFQRRSESPESESASESSEESSPENTAKISPKRNSTAKRRLVYKEPKVNPRFPRKKLQRVKKVEKKVEDDPEFEGEFSSEESDNDNQIQKRLNDELNSEKKENKERFLIKPFQITVSKTKEGKRHKPIGPPPDYKQPEAVPFHSFDPDLDPEIQKLRIELYKGFRRWKKWKKVNMHEYTELAALGLTGMITYLEFI